MKISLLYFLCTIVSFITVRTNRNKIYHSRRYDEVNRKLVFNKEFMRVESHLLNLNKYENKKIFTFLCLKFIKNIKKIFLRTENLNCCTIKSLFNDPDLKKQWYFTHQNQYNYHLSHNLDNVWRYGITGKGVNIAIIGSGVDGRHLDLKDNFSKNTSFNLITNTFRLASSQYGIATNIAGLIAAVSNNYACGVGAAPSSRISNLQIYDSLNTNIEDTRLARALLYYRNRIDIYFLILPINRDNEIRKYPGRNTKLMLKHGIRFGRSMFGSIYITGSGNYAEYGSNCAFNGFLQRPEVFVFGSISFSGSLTRYSERCNAIVASSLSTVRLFDLDMLYTTAWGGHCNASVGGSLSSAAISTGIISLLISYNKNLTARQVMILIMLTSIQYDINSIRNAAGFYYSNSFGYGLLNAKDLITYSTSRMIYHLEKEHVCSSLILSGIYNIKSQLIKNFTIYMSGCLNSEYCVTEIEQAYAFVTIYSYKRKSIYIYLTSPGGTKYLILEPRIFDHSRNGFHNYRIKLMGYFREKVVGVWMFGIYSDSISAKILNLQLLFHGTCSNPMMNLVSHDRVRTFLFAHSKNISVEFRSRIFVMDLKSFQQNNYIDVYSFTQRDFYYINKLNNIINS